MNSNLKLTTATLIVFLASTAAFAAGVTGGDALIQPTSARSAALAESLTAATDDIGAFGYNPASLDTLSSGQVSFLYQRGLVDDSYGHFMIGSPLHNKGALGLSVGYYNGGQMTVFDGVTDRTVTAKTDLTASLGYAQELGPFSVGITGKYISSELIETAKATAYAGDIGLQMPLGSRVRMGAALQNVGTKLTYVNEATDLPQIARLGVGISLFPNSYKSTLFLDAPYFMKDKELRSGIGIETLVGSLALRAGYRTGNQLSSLTFGAGILLGKATFDYSYGMVQDLQSTHRVSMNIHFGGSNQSPVSLQVTQAPSSSGPVVASKPSEPSVTFVQRSEQKKGQILRRAGEVYVVQPGDSFGKIATRMYGDAGMWKEIYAANQHLLNGSKSLEAGQRLVLP